MVATPKTRPDLFCIRADVVWPHGGPADFPGSHLVACDECGAAVWVSGSGFKAAKEGSLALFGYFGGCSPRCVNHLDDVLARYGASDAPIVIMRPSQEQLDEVASFLAEGGAP